MSNHTPITTLTLNPAVDVSYQVRQLVSADKVQANETSYSPGGNGINISRSLKRLGRDSHACCVFAGESGNLVRRLLQEEEVYPVSIQIGGESRMNSTILQRRPPDEYKISGVSPIISDAQVEEISEIFLKLAGTGYGVLSGSLPAGVDPDIYTVLARKLRAQGAKAVVDTREAVPTETLEAGPYLIKPNRYELEVISGKSLTTLEVLAEEARKVQRQGAENVCVTLASEGAILVTPDNSYFAPAPRVKIHCTVGVGDTMLAGLIMGFSEDRTPEEILKLGISCASSSITKKGTMLFNPTDLPRIQDTIKVTELSI